MWTLGRVAWSKQGIIALCLSCVFTLAMAEKRIPRALGQGMHPAGGEKASAGGRSHRANAKAQTSKVTPAEAASSLTPTMAPLGSLGSSAKVRHLGQFQPDAEELPKVAPLAELHLMAPAQSLSSTAQFIQPGKVLEEMTVQPTAVQSAIPPIAPLGSLMSDRVFVALGKVQDDPGPIQNTTAYEGVGYAPTGALRPLRFMRTLSLDARLAAEAEEASAVASRSNTLPRGHKNNGSSS